MSKFVKAQYHSSTVSSGALLSPMSFNCCLALVMFIFAAAQAHRKNFQYLKGSEVERSDYFYCDQISDWKLKPTF
jgi:hypothetical protein